MGKHSIFSLVVALICIIGMVIAYYRGDLNLIVLDGFLLIANLLLQGR